MKFEPVTLTYYRNGEDPDLAETHSHHKSEWDLLLFLLVEFGNGDPIDYFENVFEWKELFGDFTLCEPDFIEKVESDLKEFTDNYGINYPFLYRRFEPIPAGCAYGAIQILLDWVGQRTCIHLDIKEDE